jgi:hypothetical protein
VGGTYTFSLKEKVVHGDIKAWSNVVIGRNGCHLASNVIHGLVDWCRLCSRMEVVKQCAAEANLICGGAYDDVGIECERVWLGTVC